MALRLSKETNYGVAVEYWKVSQLNINWYSRSAHCELMGFVNEQARRDGKEPLSLVGFDLANDDFVFTNDGNNVAQAYTKIKTLPDWLAAEDC